MAIATLGTDASGTDADGTVSFSHTLSAGSSRVVLVRVVVDGSSDIDVDSVTYGGVSCSLVPGASAIGNLSAAYVLTEIWWCLEADLPADGSNTVSVTCSGTTINDTTAYCAAYSGIAQTVGDVQTYAASGVGVWSVSQDWEENGASFYALGSNGTLGIMTWSNSPNTPAVTDLGEVGTGNTLSVAQTIGWDANGTDQTVSATKSSGTALASMVAISIAEAPIEYSVSLDPGVIQLVGPSISQTSGVLLSPGVIELAGPDMAGVAVLSAPLDPGVIEFAGPDIIAGPSFSVPLDPGVIELAGPDMVGSLSYVSGPRLSIWKTADDSFVESFEIAVDPEVTIDGNQLTVTPSPLSAGTGYYILVDSDAILGSVSGYSWPGISSKTVWNFST